MSVPSLLTDSWTDLEKYFGFNGKTTADTTGMTPTQAKAAAAGATLKNAGVLTSVLGGISSAIGSFYAAKTAQYEQKSQSLSYQFQSDMAAINASQAEMNAQSIEEQGKQEVSQYTMRAGQERAATVASMGGRGIVIGQGSSGDVLASEDLVKDVDVMTINANATRAAWAQRQQGTNYKNESLLDRTSAGNATRTSGTISPLASAGTSLMSSAAGIASQWDWRRKIAMATAGGSY